MLGGVTAIPATLLGIYSIIDLGPVAAASVVVVCSFIVALLGGGGLRQWGPHG